MSDSRRRSIDPYGAESARSNVKSIVNIKAKTAAVNSVSADSTEESSKERRMSNSSNADSSHSMKGASKEESFISTPMYNSRENDFSLGVKLDSYGADDGNDSYYYTNNATNSTTTNIDDDNQSNYNYSSSSNLASDSKQKEKKSRDKRGGSSAEIEGIRKVLSTMFKLTNIYGQHKSKVRSKAFFFWKTQIEYIKFAERHNQKHQHHLQNHDRHHSITSESKADILDGSSPDSNSKLRSENDYVEVGDLALSEEDGYTTKLLDGEQDGKKTLDLWTKHQALRDEFHELKKSTSMKEAVLRQGGKMYLIISIIRSTLKLKKNRAFNRWLMYTNSKLMEKNIVQQKMKLDVGMKHIDSKQRTMKKIESENDLLKRNSMYHILFNKWKLNSLTAKLEQERNEYEAQKVKIMKEVLFLKDLIRKNAVKEAHLVQITKEKGTKYHADLEKLRGNLASAYELLSKQKQMSDDLNSEPKR